MADYWDRWWDRRVGRRGLLAGGGVAAAGAAGLALVGCGDDDDDESPTAAATTAAATGTAATATATEEVLKPNIGGTIRFPMVGISSGDPPTLFPYENLTYLAQVPSSYHYSRLLRSVSGPPTSRPPTTPSSKATSSPSGSSPTMRPTSSRSSRT